MSTLALFGGSFDPPHVGHVLAVRYLLSVGAADALIIIPVFEHAFDKHLSPFEQRVRLVELAFEDEPRARVSTIESRLPRPNYTLNTVMALKREYPEDDLRLVVGADVLQDVDKWHRFDQLVSLCPLLVLGRRGVEHPEAPPAYLPDVSSSEIRALLASRSRGDDPDERSDQVRWMLPRAVLLEIQKRDWYR